MIRSSSGKFYTGITTDLERRFSEHQKGSRGARFFYFSKPEVIVFRESHPNRSAASRRENAIKKMTRAEKQLLIHSTIVPIKLGGFGVSDGFVYEER